MTITEPAWLLLLWAGVAATLAAAIVGAPPGATLRHLRRVRARVRAARRTPIGPALATLAVGVLVYPVAYGLIFEAAARADFGFGAGIGAIHGLIAASLRIVKPPAGRRAAPIFRLLLARLAYGAVLGFLYAVPSPPA